MNENGRGAAAGGSNGLLLWARRCWQRALGFFRRQASQETEEQEKISLSPPPEPPPEVKFCQPRQLGGASFGPSRPFNGEAGDGESLRRWIETQLDEALPDFKRRVVEGLLERVTQFRAVAHCPGGAIAALHAAAEINASATLNLGLEIRSRGIRTEASPTRAFEIIFSATLKD